MRDDPSSSNKDIDEAAKPYMQQAKDALGDVTDDQDLESPGKRSPRQDDLSSHSGNDMP